MTLKVYYDLMSQPCRALWMFLKANNIPFVPCEVALRKGEHFEDKFKEVNPFQRVPCIDHDGFKLTETIAIMRYLCTQFPVKDHWYPADVRKRARVDEYMAWQHMNLRFFGSMMFQKRVIQGKKEPNPLFQGGLDKCLDQIEQIYLKDSPFVNGFNEITFADLLAVCEIEQPIAAGFDVTKERPKLHEYMERVRSRMNPFYDEAHKVPKLVRSRVDAGKL